VFVWESNWLDLGARGLGFCICLLNIGGVILAEKKIGWMW
jgi:hypothetical protein